MPPVDYIDRRFQRKPKKDHPWRNQPNCSGKKAEESYAKLEERRKQEENECEHD